MIDWTEENALEMLRERNGINMDYASSKVNMEVVVALCDRVEELTAQCDAMIDGVEVQKSGTLSCERSIVGTFSGVTHVFLFGRGPSGPRAAWGAQPTTKAKQAISRVFIYTAYFNIG